MSELFHTLIVKLILIKHNKTNQLNCAVGEIYSQLLINMYNTWTATFHMFHSSEKYPISLSFVHTVYVV